MKPYLAGDLRTARALTLWQPWATAIARCSKRIENRDWPPPEWQFYHPMFVHAGATFDREAARDLRLKGLLRGDEPLPDRAIVAVCRVVGVTRSIGFARDLGFDARWWEGPLGWLLDDVVALAEPVRCSGAQNLWRPPVEVVEDVVRQVAAQGVAP